ncbi:MAG: methyltransferase domain-containing protein [Candidatus Methylomirabilota bacterium]|jgi:phosphatidylethanolamine/phosphatidyl-N-methylethanolamine N-methyltransferase
MPPFNDKEVVTLGDGKTIGLENIRGGRAPSARMLDYRTVTRAYAFLTPVYDILFNKIFHSGRVAAIDLLEIKPGDRVLEIGVGTGLNLPLYPRDCQVTGIDISVEMLQKARERSKELGLTSVTLGLMDASDLEFPDDTFDHVLATYVISAVPDPVKTLVEMRRVCRPKGHLVILNHFRSENPILGAVEWMLAPVCTRIGFKTDLKLKPLLEKAALSPDQMHRINVMMMNGWRLVRCIKPQ